MIVDSQAVKNTCNASVESKGFCHYKCVNGIKRHLAVDTLGFPFFTHCTKANVSDDQGLIEMLSHNIDYFRAKPVNIPKITILLDHGYHPSKIIVALQKLYPQILTKLRFELAPKPTKAAKSSGRRIPSIELRVFVNWADITPCLTTGQVSGQKEWYSILVLMSENAPYPYITAWSEL